MIAEVVMPTTWASLMEVGVSAISDGVKRPLREQTLRMVLILETLDLIQM